MVKPCRKCSELNTLIITINEAIALALGVKDVVSGMQLKINVKEGSNIHSTVKPTALMEYLVTMASRERATVFDPLWVQEPQVWLAKDLTAISSVSKWTKLISTSLKNE